VSVNDWLLLTIRDRAILLLEDFVAIKPLALFRCPAGSVGQGKAGCRPPPRLILEIDIRERLAVVVVHDKAGVLLLDRLGRREVASSHRPSRQKVNGQSDHYDPD